MKTKRMAGLLAALTLGIILFANRSLAAAFGVSPPWIVNENLKPDSHYVYVIDLTTNDPREDMNVIAKLSGDPEILKWLTIRDSEKLVMPKGQQHVPLYVEVNVPKTAKVGLYNGNISLTVAPEQISSGNISILLGGNISVSLKVINYDVTDYWVRSIALEPIYEGQSLSMTMGVKNLGNVPLSSIPTKIEVLDYKSQKPVASATADRLNKSVYPQTMEDVQLIAPLSSLKAGEYWVKVDALKTGTSVYQNRLYLEVKKPALNSSVKTAVEVAKGNEPIKAAYTSPTTNNGNIQLQTTVTVRAPFTNQLIIVVIVLLLVVIGISGKIYTVLRKKNGGHPAHPHHH